MLWVILLIVIITLIVKYITTNNITMKDITTNNITIKEGFTCKETKQAISDYPKTYNLDPLFNGTFKPECCPSPYSTSSGCLCNDVNTTELIIVRGGNRIMC
jgi:hypothetical protein